MSRSVEWTAEHQIRFTRICASRWGFRYSADDDFTLRNVVERAFQASATQTLDAFANLIESLPDENPEVQAFIALMTVGETSFFRDSAQISALREVVIPDLVERNQDTRRLRIWSAGCASGEEPYTLAILLSEIVPDWSDWDIKILGTDLNRFSLRRARAALYSQWSLRGIDPAYAERYFKPAGRLVRLDHRCKRLVSFFRHNLITENVPDAERGLSQLDLIMCRNVMIYFERNRTQELVGKLYGTLKRQGWLLVGHAEPDGWVYRQYETVEYPETVLYRKPEVDIKTDEDEPEDNVEIAPTPAPARPVPIVDTKANTDTATTLSADALVAYQNKDVASAYELLVAASKLDLSDPLPTHLLAQLAADEKAYDEALFWAYRTLQRSSFHLPTLLLMGLVQLETGAADEARASLQQALFVDPLCPEAHLYLSFAWKALSMSDEEQRSRARAVRLIQEAPGPWTDLLPIQRSGRAAVDLLARSEA